MSLVIVEPLNTVLQGNWTLWREKVSRAFMNSLVVHMEDVRCQGKRLKRMMDARHAFLCVSQSIQQLHGAVLDGRVSEPPTPLHQFASVMKTNAAEVEKIVMASHAQAGDPLDTFIFHFEHTELPQLPLYSSQGSPYPGA